MQASWAGPSRSPPPSRRRGRRARRDPRRRWWRWICRSSGSSSRRRTLEELFQPPASAQGGAHGDRLLRPRRAARSTISATRATRDPRLGRALRALVPLRAQRPQRLRDRARRAPEGARLHARPCSRSRPRHHPRSSSGRCVPVPMSSRSGQRRTSTTSSYTSSSSSSSPRSPPTWSATTAAREHARALLLDAPSRGTTTRWAKIAALSSTPARAHRSLPQAAAVRRERARSGRTAWTGSATTPTTCCGSSQAA